jgi:hypothetical protein
MVMMMMMMLTTVMMVSEVGLDFHGSALSQAGRLIHNTFQDRTEPGTGSKILS